jgi:hypothetical protein
MPTPFHFYLILEVHRRRPRSMQKLHRSTRKKIPAPTRINIHQHRKIGGITNSFYLFRDLLQRGET